MELNKETQEEKATCIENLENSILDLKNVAEKDQLRIAMSSYYLLYR